MWERHFFRKIFSLFFIHNSRFRVRRIVEINFQIKFQIDLFPRNCQKFFAKNVQKRFPRNCQTFFAKNVFFSSPKYAKFDRVTGLRIVFRFVNLLAKIFRKTYPGRVPIYFFSSPSSQFFILRGWKREFHGWWWKKKKFYSFFFLQIEQKIIENTIYRDAARVVVVVVFFLQFFFPQFFLLTSRRTTNKTNKNAHKTIKLLLII